MNNAIKAKKISFSSLLRSWRFWLALVLLFIIFMFVGNPFGNKSKTPVISTTTVERGDIENLVTATGILQPRDYVDVGAQVSGQLKTLLVDVGTEVKQGDLLAEIDATVYMANVDATRAQLRNQKAQMLEREASLQLAQLTYNRQQNLLKEEATTLESLQNAEASLKSAKAQIESLSAQMQQTESSLRAEEAKLEYASIYAPMDGTVVSVTTKQGQTLNANQTAPILLRIADLSSMKVKAQVSEADVGKLKVGMNVYFTTLGSDGRRWYGTLERIEPTPETLNNVVLYNALFHVPNETRELMSDMTAQIFFIAGQANDVITAPLSALTIMPNRGQQQGSMNNAERPRMGADGSGGGHPEGATRSENSAERRGPPRNVTPLAAGERRARATVLVNNVAEERVVVIGISNRVTAEIKSGLSEGDVLVLNTQKSTSSSGTQPRRDAMGQPRMMR